MFFDRLDRDGDGTLGGDEIENAPGFFKGMIERAGIQAGASRDDFSRDFGRMQEEFQGGRDREGEGGERGREARNASKYYVPAKKDPITIDLPDDYRGRDLDADGQIGLYEWREWDRGSLDEFFALDRNGDGFLTPREIAAGPAGNEADGGPERQEVAVRGPAGSPPPANDEQIRKGKQIFGILDRDRDGKASPDELTKLNKLRPGFEKAGIRLDREMTQDEFVKNYVRSLQG